MRVLIAGAVAWTDEDAVRRELAKLPSPVVVVQGDSPGADALAGRIAVELGFSVEAMGKSKDDYAKYKRGAWKALNERMLASGVELVLVFHPDLESSRGSKHLAKAARAAGVEVRVFAE